MDSLRKHLLDSLKGGQAHTDFESAVRDFPVELYGQKPPHASHSAWQLLEHLRIAQHDILEFSRDTKHISPKWPDEYWPKEPAPSNRGAWKFSVEAFQKDHEAFRSLVADPAQDLLSLFPHGDGQTLLREALLIIDHNSYHIGQLVMLRIQLEGSLR